MIDVTITTTPGGNVWTVTSGPVYVETYTGFHTLETGQSWAERFLSFLKISADPLGSATGRLVYRPIYPQEVEDVVTPADTGILPSGGIPEDRGPSREQTRRSRVLHGIEREIVQAVAERQVEGRQFGADEVQRQQELAGELRLRNIELRSDHLQALADQRQALIDAELGRRLRAIERDNQDVLLLLMMAASA